jgi:hypothetical protein
VSVSSGSSRMRCIITGTTISAAVWCCAVSDSVSSGSNLRLSTSVEDRLMPSVKCTKPHEWNIGAAIIVFSRAFSGIMASSAAAGSSDLGCEREAPFGVPVVPEVRMIALPRSLGGLTGAVSPLADISSSSGSRGLPSSASCQAMKRLRRREASWISSSNS